MENNRKATNQDVTGSLEAMNKGQNASGNQLVFDPISGEFVVAAPGQPTSGDGRTINSIAQDGFAKP